jgi:hypothetical protein
MYMAGFFVLFTLAAAPYPLLSSIFSVRPLSLNVLFAWKAMTLRTGLFGGTNFINFKNC